MNYLIADFLIRLKNAYMARKREIEYPYANTVVSIAKILENKGYIKNVEKEKKDGAMLKVSLLYKNRKAVMKNVKIISKPSVRVYAGKSDIPSTRGGHGITIISTSKGMMTDKEAREKNVGGEIVCQIF